MNYENHGEYEFKDIPTESEIAQWQREHEKLEKAQIHHYLARTYLKEYETGFLKITQNNVNELISVIEHGMHPVRTGGAYKL